MTPAFPPVHSAVEVRMRGHHPSLLPPTTSINPQTHSPCQILMMQLRSQPQALLRPMVETKMFPPGISRPRSGETLSRLLIPLPDNSPHLLLLVAIYLFKQMASRLYLPAKKLHRLILTNKLLAMTTFSLQFLLPRARMKMGSI